MMSAFFINRPWHTPSCKDPYLLLLGGATAFLTSFSSSFPGSLRIVPEIAPTDFAARATGFPGALRVLCKVPGTASLLGLCHSRDLI